MHWRSHSLHHISGEHGNPIWEVSPELLPTQEIHPWAWPHDLLRTGKAEWRHVIHYAEVKKEVSGRKCWTAWEAEEWRERILLVPDSLEQNEQREKWGCWRRGENTTERARQFNLRSGCGGQNLATIFGNKLREEM